MWKKRSLSDSRVNYPYKSITYTVRGGGGTVDLTQFLNQLHSTQLDYIDEALEKSDLKEANDVIAHIKRKINNER
jgi:hypothetical protein